MLKIPDVYELCIIYRLLKNRKIDKKKPKVRSIDARTIKTLISHFSTQINVIQYFRSIFYWYLKAMHILQTKNNN